MKYGHKNNYYFLERKALSRKREEAKEVAVELSNFKKLLKHNKNSVFSDAKYFNKARQECLRLPSRSPDEKYVIPQLDHFYIE